MVTVTFIDPSGKPHEVEAADGDTLMEAAITHEIPGIIGHCGGMCSCGTCHCYVAADWQARLLPPEAPELDTLTHVLDREPRSRLGCQIRLGDALDGLVVTVPQRQRRP
jgi:2Fe-2S ferredoxin